MCTKMKKSRLSVFNFSLERYFLIFYSNWLLNNFYAIIKKKERELKKHKFRAIQ